jgi:hypothetical protein
MTPLLFTGILTIIFYIGGIRIPQFILLYVDDCCVHNKFDKMILRSHFLGLVSDFINKVGPDSHTSRQKSDGRSDFFGQKTTFRVGQNSRTKVGQEKKITRKNSTEYDLWNLIVLICIGTYELALLRTDLEVGTSTCW